jgi:hypothetical protein
MLWRYRSHREAALAAVSGIAMLGSFEIGKFFVAREQAIWLAPLGTVVYVVLLLRQLRRHNIAGFPLLGKFVFKPVSTTHQPSVSDSPEIRDLSSRYALSADFESKLIWGFLVLGLVARCVRYFLKFPLWEDEAFLCVNLLDRDYAELRQPLVYGQVAPLLFLVAQLSIVKLIGFHELSLRLLSFLSGVGSLLLFTHLSRKWLRGTPLVLAVALFSVAYPCIRYSAEAKPYGIDLFVALALLAMAWHYWQAKSGRARISWLASLCAFLPLALGLSYPAVFVAGGISLSWLWLMIRRYTTGWLAWSFFNGLLLASFAAVYLLVMRVQMQSQLSFMQEFWQTTFPPWSTPWKLPIWLAIAHTSDLVAYPAGGGHGGSAATFVLLAVGIALAVRSRRWSFLMLCLAPLALTFVAASLRLYPYGGSVRLNIYMAPAFCILAGLGAAHLVQLATRPRWGAYSFHVAAGILALVGIASIGRDALHPYKALSDHRARAFAQWFWFNASRDGEVACALTDLRQNFAPDLYQRLNWTAEYLCNQRIYSPRHASRANLPWDRITAEHPLRCVVYRDQLTSFDPAARDRWMQSMQAQFELVGQEAFPLVRLDKRERNVLATDHVEIYKFVPRRDARVQPAGAGGASL